MNAKLNFRYLDNFCIKKQCTPNFNYFIEFI